MTYFRTRRLVLCACAALVTACGDGSTRSGADGHAPPADAAEVAPLRRSSGSEVDSLDPVLATLTDSGDIIRDAYEGLTTLDAYARPAPGLAERWAVSADGLTYTFHLRATARWSNGEPVTSDDVLASWRRLLDPKTGSPWVQNLHYISGAEAIAAGTASPGELGATAPDARTLIVTLRGPAPFFPALLAHWSLVPTYRGAAPAKPGDTISNGAYVIAEAVANSHVVLRKNPAYYGASDVRIGTVRYVQISELSDEYNRFRAGEIDITSNSPMQPLDETRAAVGDRLKVSPFLALYYYGFNTKKAPFNSRALRQALSMSVDREKLTHVVLRLGNPPAYSLVPEGTPDYTPQRPAWAASPHAQRLERARMLYAEAGYGARNPLRFELRYNTGAGHEKIALAIAAMWKESLGAEARLVPEEFKSLLQTVQRGDAQIFRSSWTADYPDALTFLQNYAATNPMNLSSYENASFDAALRAAVVESDPGRRRALLQDAERQFAADAPIIPIYFMVSRRLVSSRVAGWRDNPMRLTYSRSLSLLH